MVAFSGVITVEISIVLPCVTVSFTSSVYTFPSLSAIATETTGTGKTETVIVSETSGLSADATVITASPTLLPDIVPMSFLVETAAIALSDEAYVTDLLVALSGVITAEISIV